MYDLKHFLLATPNTIWGLHYVPIGVVVLVDVVVVLVAVLVVLVAVVVVIVAIVVVSSHLFYL